MRPARPLASEMELRAVAVAMKLVAWPAKMAKVMRPKIIQKTAKALPGRVAGPLSPKPLVVCVTMAHQRPSPSERRTEPKLVQTSVLSTEL